MLNTLYRILFIASILLLGCNSEKEEIVMNNQELQTKSSNTFQITNHFDNWLQNNGYANYNFKGDPDYSYGGKQFSSETLNNHPVIFIHGNGDKAIGWEDSINYFLSNGYSKKELYAFTWGNASINTAYLNYHSKIYLERVRAFIKAVKEYTGAQKVDIITHSMGVTLGRKAIKGGNAYDQNYGNYNLGTSLNYIDTFVGIAGANKGLTSCYGGGASSPTCNSSNGFYPGYLLWGTGPYGASNLLTELNNNPTKEGDFVYSIWSSVDQVIGYGCIVYGRNTSRINTQNGEKSFHSMPYGHFGVKNLTGYYQLKMVKHHTIN